MAEIYRFAQSHWVSVLAFACVFILWLLNEVFFMLRRSCVLSVQDFIAHMNKKQARVVDVRPREAFVQERLVGALHKPLAELSADDALFIKDKDKILLMYDESETDLLLDKVLAFRKAGYKSVHILSDGFKSWKKAEMPTVKGESK